MTRKGHMEEQIIAALQQAEAGAKTGELCCKLGISHILQLEEAVCRLGRAGAARAAAVARRERPVKTNRCGLDARPADPAGDRLKKAVKPRQKRRLVRWTREAYRISERRAIPVVGMRRSSCRYRSRARKPGGTAAAIKAATHVRYGYRRLTVLLRREGWPAAILEISASRAWGLENSGPCIQPDYTPIRCLKGSLEPRVIRRYRLRSLC